MKEVKGVDEEVLVKIGNGKRTRREWNGWRGRKNVGSKEGSERGNLRSPVVKKEDVKKTRGMQKDRRKKRQK